MQKAGPFLENGKIRPIIDQKYSNSAQSNKRMEYMKQTKHRKNHFEDN